MTNNISLWFTSWLQTLASYFPVVLVMVHLLALNPYLPRFFQFRLFEFSFYFCFLFVWKCVIHFLNYIKHVLMTNNMFLFDIIMYLYQKDILRSKE